MGRWGAADLECLSAGCSQVVGDGEAALWDAGYIPKQALGSSCALGVINQEEGAGGKWDCGLAAAAWKMEVVSSLQLVVVGMEQPRVTLCH